MRNPARQRNVSLAVLAVSAGVLVAGIAYPPDKDTWLAALLVIDITVAFFALCAAIAYQYNAHRQAHLLAGHDLIARWRVDARRWDEFAAVDATLNRRKGKPANTIKLRTPAPHDGVEIVVGKSAVMVGDDFNALDFGEVVAIEWIDGPPPGLAFDLFYANSEGPPVEKTLRFPTGANRESDAKRVIDHYRARMNRPVPENPWIGFANRHPERARNIALGVMAASVLATVAGFALAPRHDLGLLPLIAAVSGPLVFIGAAIIALWTYFETRK